MAKNDRDDNDSLFIGDKEYIHIEKFSKIKNINPEKVISMVKDGVYIGQQKDGNGTFLPLNFVKEINTKDLRSSVQTFLNTAFWVLFYTELTI